MNTSLGNIFILLTFSGEASEMGIDFSKFKNLEHVRLQGMNEEDLEQLLSTKIGIDSIPDELISLTKKVAKGNPFFSLEFVNYLIDEELLLIDDTSCMLSEGVHKGEHVLPDNIRGALRQRIDKLDPGSQLTLKVGSVVGYKFGKDIVGDIYPIMNERHYVHTYLDEAQSSGFLVDTVVDNYDGYFFNNSAVADVSYDSILADQKRFLHEKSALWYEKNFENNLQPFYVRLAYHWNEAGDKIKSLTYFKLESTRLFSLGFVRQAMLVGMEGVKILDYTLSLDKEIIGSQIGEYTRVIQGLMEGKSIPELFKHKTLENSQTDELIDMLLYLSPLAHQCHEAEFFALLSIICLKITLEEGNGVMASKVYAMYSIIYKAFTGDSVNALEWSNLALALDKKNDNMHKASVSFIHGWFIAHWMKPVRSLIPLADEGAEAGFESGDILYACFNLSLSVILKNAAGVQLEKVIESANVNLVKNNNIVVNAAFHLKHEKQIALAFQGKTNSYVSLSDEHIDEDMEIAVICESDMYNQIGYYFISKLKLNAHYGKWQEALSWGDKAFPLLMAFANQPGQVDLEFYYGLSCLYRSAEEEGESSDELLQRAEQSLESFENWSGTCAENFMHKYQIIKAVKDSLNGDHQSAEVLFQEAATHARKGKFYQDEGLAYEHWMRMNQRLEKDFSNQVIQAKEAYSLWGAKAKMNYLETEFNT
jgi:predicted ATPase